MQPKRIAGDIKKEKQDRIRTDMMKEACQKNLFFGSESIQIRYDLASWIQIRIDFDFLDLYTDP